MFVRTMIFFPLLQIAAMDSADAVKFRFEGAQVTAEALEEFAKGVVDGTAPRVSVSGE